MRLSENEKTKIIFAIKELSASYKLPLIQIALFGSRTKDSERGGDIDLYIKYGTLHNHEVRHLRREIISLLHKAIGEQKIDLIIDWPENKSNRSFIENIKPQLLKLY